MLCIYFAANKLVTTTTTTTTTTTVHWLAGSGQKEPMAVFYEKIEWMKVVPT